MNPNLATVGAHLCPKCWRVTWQPPSQPCLLCQTGAQTRA